MLELWGWKHNNSFTPYYHTLTVIVTLVHSYHCTYNHLTNVWKYAGPTGPPACPPTCRLRWDGAASFLALCWPSPRAWASSSSNSCCRVSSAESEQPGKNQSSSISFVPQGKGECGLDWGCIYGWEAGIKWVGQNDGGVEGDRMKETEKRRVCVGRDGVVMKREMRHLKHHRWTS